MVPNAVTEISDTLVRNADWALGSVNLLSQTAGKATMQSEFISSPIVGGVFIFILIVLLILNSSIGNFFRLYFSSIFFTKDLQKIRMKGENMVFLEALMVFASFILSYRIIDKFEIQDYDIPGLRQWQVFILIPTLLFILFWLRYLILELMDKMLNQKGQFSIIQVASLNFYVLTVMIMSAYDFMNTALIHGSEAMRTAYPYIEGILFLMYLGYIYRLIHALRLRKLYMILYLCALEILPLAGILILLFKYI